MGSMGSEGKQQLSGYGAVMVQKDKWAAAGKGITSLRDFGGVYLVKGRYLLGGGGATRVSFVSMVDTLANSPDFLEEVGAFSRRYPAKEVELIVDDFRRPETFRSLRPSDKSLLYEVLLHQENFVDVVNMVRKATRKEVVVAQPVLKPRLYSLPGSCSLLQFWPEELKEELRHASFWPRENRPKVFDTSKWMWGHTASLIDDVFKGFGWKKTKSTTISNVTGEYWDYYLAKFSPN